MRSKIEYVLRCLKDSHPAMEHIFKRGACFNLYAILKPMFPEIEPFHDDGAHIYIKYRGAFFDIDGRLEDAKTISRLLPVRNDRFIAAQAHKWHRQGLERKITEKNAMLKIKCSSIKRQRKKIRATVAEYNCDTCEFLVPCDQKRRGEL